MIEPGAEHVRDETFDQADMRLRIRRDALRCALMYWYHCTPLEECRADLWGAAMRVERQLGARDFKVAPLAHDELDAQIAWVGAYHDESWGLMRDAAAAALLGGQDKQGVMKAAVAVARERAPLPAPYIVQQAVAAAARAHRFDERWWQRRGRTG